MTTKTRKPARAIRKPNNLHDFVNSTVGLIREHPTTNAPYIYVSVTSDTPEQCRKIANWLLKCADWLDQEKHK